MKCLRNIILVLAGTALAGAARADQTQDQFLEIAEPLIFNSCIDCHEGSSAEAGVDLDIFEEIPDAEGLFRDQKKWLSVARVLEDGSMPPKDHSSADEITPDQRATVSAWLREAVWAYDASNIDEEAHTLPRRLTRVEYGNTIQDLLGVEVPVDVYLPADDTTAFGFANTAHAMTISEASYEKYLRLADLALEPLFAGANEPQSEAEPTAEPQPLAGVKVQKTYLGPGTFKKVGAPSKPGRVKLQPGEVVRFTPKPPKAGWYQVVIRGDARGKPALAVATNGEPGGDIADFAEDAAPLVELRPSENELLFANQGSSPLIVKGLQLIGPFEAPEGVESSRTVAWRESFNAAIENPEKMSQLGPEAIGQFATAAYRFPAGERELKPVIDVFNTVLEHEKDPRLALQTAFKTVLVSPYFLYRFSAQNVQDGDFARLSDYALASRLSYFLWSTMPDQELLDLASRNELHKPGVLRAQVKRMVRDDRIRSIAENFAVGWLWHHLEELEPDSSIFPSYNEELGAAMHEELVRFITGLFQENRPLGELVDADYTYVNSELAEFYDLPFRGEGWQKVALKDERRGGLLTMAANLQRTSMANRTSPTKRGNWVLEAILGTPPPPPPANVEAITDEPVEVNGVKRELTFRERLVRHRDQEASCFSCHQKMDPLGYALENYDALGRWREHDNEVPIDSSGELPGGKKLDGIASLKKVLNERKEEIAYHFTEKLMVYALGRGIEWYDRWDVKNAFDQAREEGLGGCDLLEAIVVQPVFQGKQEGNLTSQLRN